jgi:ABC-type multidrug transport system ATPase subunit
MIRFIAENLSCHFGDAKVFGGVSCTASQGEILAVTGKNGSGKTSLLKICAGVLAPSSGSLSLKAGEAEQVLPSDAVALVTPACMWYKQLTVRENLILYSRGKSLEGSTDLYVNRFSLSQFLDMPVSQLSSGNALRLSLAAAFGLNAKLILLDEPSSHLDSGGKRILIEILAEKKKDAVILIATHDEQEISLSARSIALG